MTTRTIAANEPARLPGLEDNAGISGNKRRARTVARTPAGTYSLPHDIKSRLTAALAGFKNGEAAMALALFLARYWSSRARMARPFPVDRRALADRADLGLTEARIRGALRTLEAVGFLNRGLPAPGSVHQLKPSGELHRRPILYGFGADYGPLFAAANMRAERARARREGRAVPQVRASNGKRLPISISPKDKNRTGGVVIMGDREKGFPKKPGVGRAAGPTPVEEALERLRVAMGLVQRHGNK